MRNRISIPIVLIVVAGLAALGRTPAVETTAIQFAQGTGDPAAIGVIRDYG